MKILGGDWPAGHNAALRRTFTGKPGSILLFRNALSYDAVAVDQVESADLVTQENRTSIAGKLGWGAVGAVALGPLGLLAGVLGGGNRTSMVLAVKFKDGRAVLLEGKSKDMQAILGAAFSTQANPRG